jgi:hypothetical protein
VTTDPSITNIIPSGRSIPARIAVLQRRRMFRRYVQTIGVDSSYRVVDVGVTNNEGYVLDNYFEAFYPWKEKITAAGIEDGSRLARLYPGVRFVRIQAGPLPFEDQSFDVAHPAPSLSMSEAARVSGSSCASSGVYREWGYSLPPESVVPGRVSHRSPARTLAAVPDVPGDS